MKILRSVTMGVVLLVWVSTVLVGARGVEKTSDLAVNQPTPIQPVEEDIDSGIPPVIDGVPYAYPVISSRPTVVDEIQEPSAPTINVWYGTSQIFGHKGIPQKWANIVGAVITNTHPVSLTYSLNGGPELPLNTGPDERRLYDQGAYNIELAYQSLLPGDNEVIIKLVDGSDTITKPVTVNYTAGKNAPMPYTIDWSKSGGIQNVSQVVDGLWAIKNGALYMSAHRAGYDRLVNIGDLNWKDYEITVPITVHSINNLDPGFSGPSQGGGIGFIVGWQGHYLTGKQWEPPGLGWRRNIGALAWFRWNDNLKTSWQLRGKGGDYLVDKSPPPDEQIEMGKTYNFKLSVQSSNIPGAPATYRFKFWEQGKTEPSLWYMQSEGVAGEPESGSILLVAHQVEASFGDVKVKPINKNAKLELDTRKVSNGEIIIEPLKNTYSYGERVSVRAFADSGFRLNKWGHDFASLGSENPVVFDITQDMTVSAGFTSADDPTLTVINSGKGQVEVSPLKSRYRYGEIITLTPKPGKNQLFANWSGALAGADNPASLVVSDDNVTQDNILVTATFLPADPTSPVSDDFSGNGLNKSLWTFVNPVGDGTQDVDNGKLYLTVPEGISHNIWLDGNRSARVMQDLKDGNFEIIAKFDSEITERFQMQGILVEQDSGNFLRFEIHHDGSAVEVYAAQFMGGKPQTAVAGKVLPETPSYLRVTRAEDTWSFSYSFDGETYFSAGSFDRELNVTSAGVFSGNHSTDGVSSPAHTAIIDYFFNSVSPLSTEHKVFLPVVTAPQP